MSNKPMINIDISDMALRIGNPVGMEDGVKQVIIRHCGFELYNTRPYHNYESWSDGYIVIGRKDGKAAPLYELMEAYAKNKRDDHYIVSSEDLDDAVIEFVNKLGTKDRVIKWANASMSKGQNRVMMLRKKFSKS